MPEMDANTLETARSLLPAWVVWLPVAASVAAALLVALATALAVAWLGRDLTRLPPDAHWSDRARAAWPLRRAWVLLMPATAFLSLALAVGGPLSRPPGALRWALAIGLPVVSLAAVAIAAEHRLVPGIGVADRLRSVAAYMVVLFAPYLAAAALAASSGSDPRPAAVAISLALVSALALGGSLLLGRALGLVRPAPDRAVRLLASARSRSPGRRVRIVELRIAGANAFAFPLLGLVAVTPRALAALADDEVAAVLAHELGHVDEPRIVRALRAAAAVATPCALVAGPSVLARWDTLGLGLLVAAVLVWLSFHRILQRSMEERADGAADVHGLAYARALEALHRANLVPAVLGRRASHPDLYDRLTRAGAPPAWPRPDPPRTSRVLFAAVSLAAAVLYVGAGVGAVFLAPADDRNGLLAAVAVQQAPRDVARLAAWHAARGEAAPALALYAAAEEMDPRGLGYAADRAAVLAGEGRCAEAWRELERAAADDATSEEIRDAVEAVGGCVEPAR